MAKFKCAGEVGCGKVFEEEAWEEETKLALRGDKICTFDDARSSEEYRITGFFCPECSNFIFYTELEKVEEVKS